MPDHHRITVADGESIAAIHHATDGEARGWVVCCHGFVSDKTGTYEGRCERAVAEGYHGVRFDFRGCGKSDGRFIDQRLSTKIADLRAVVDYFGVERLVLFGSSFGSKVAFHAAPGFAERGVEVAALLARAPVTANHTFADRRARVEREGKVPVGAGHAIDARFFDDLEEYPFPAVAGQLSCPVLIVHGAEDESVDVADSFEAAAMLETDVVLEKISDEGHRFSRSAERRLRTRCFDVLGTWEA